MLNVRLVGGYLYGKQLFTWLSLVMSLMESFCAFLFFLLDVLDEIWDVIESVREGFLTYSYGFEFFNSISVISGRQEGDNEGCVEGSLVYAWKYRF